MSARTCGHSKAWVELCCRRDCFKSELPQRDHFDPSNAGLAALHPVYEQANDRVWVRQELPLAAGEFATKLAIPAEGYAQTSNGPTALVTGMKPDRMTDLSGVEKLCRSEKR